MQRQSTTFTTLQEYYSRKHIFGMLPLVMGEKKMFGNTSLNNVKCHVFFVCFNAGLNI